MVGYSSLCSACFIHVLSSVIDHCFVMNERINQSINQTMDNGLGATRNYSTVNENGGMTSTPRWTHSTIEVESQ